MDSNHTPNLGSIDLQLLAQIVAQITSMQSASTKSTVSPHLDLASPYYLHPADSPGNRLISRVLDHQNYHNWSHYMLLALKSKNKLAFIDGTLPKPPVDDPLFEAWDRCNTFVVSWIHLSLSSDIAQSVMGNSIGKDLWQELKNQFYQGDVFKIAELQEKLFSIKQGDLSVTHYFTKLKGIWEDLETFRSLPQCNCTPKCTCVFDTVSNYQNDTFVV
ncbi:uncharacterized protein LOC110266826 [Arachis ipaensis]|uniref:uncharacterized protein LOC110266826 n=1 Tax=Arachis ipaensis TaxID=130454 RepID=UPI000A2B64C7|nr:uncharacterized protein LOC110266826 [Arachis ipaensis]XP_025678409.1 uncharacterized protein LOC112778289 [Arachis hypogaea]